MPRNPKTKINSASPQPGKSAPAFPADERSEELFDLVARSQKSFRELIDSFDHIAFNLSLDGKLKVINRQFAETAGLPFSAIVNHPVEEFISEPTREELARGLPGFLKKRSWSGIVRVRWRNQREARFYDCTLYAVLKDGQVTGVSGLARDISSQREAESRFADLFETLHEGVFFAAPTGELLDVNPATVRILGYKSKEELLKLPMKRHFADPAVRESLVADLRSAGFVRDRELSLRRKDGSTVHVLSSAVSIRDAKGEIVRFQGSLVDITEREQMQKRLREEQEFVRRLVACFPDIITVLDTVGRYTFVSPRVQEVLGYTAEEFIGLRLEERPHPEDRASLLEFFRRLTSGEIPFGAVEYRTTHKNGGWRMVRANASPLTNAEGQIIGVVASARDVTEARQMQAQLLQSEKLAAIGQMVSGVAHELNNPLTAILGVSDLLREKTADEPSRRQAEMINKQARRAAELVQGLLMFSRPSPPQTQNVRVTELIARAIELRKAELQARHISVQIDAAAGLPMVEVNPNHLVQVFVNILANAEQAIDAARDHGQIKVRVVSERGKQEILVDDDGPGVPQEIRSKIFDPFFTTHRSTGGAGLGLTIALVIIKEHGGTIEAQASPSGGARFRIVLPEAQGAALAEAPESRQEKLAGHSILIVEDEQGVRELVEEALKSHGAAVDAVETAEDARKRLRSRDYHVVLCDLNLENESGFELFEQISTEKKDATPLFIFMTGELLDAKQLSKIELKSARALLKPFRMSEMIAAVEAAISSLKMESVKR